MSIFDDDESELAELKAEYYRKVSKMIRKLNASILGLGFEELAYQYDEFRDTVNSLDELERQIENYDNDE